MKTVAIRDVIEAVAALVGWMPQSSDGIRAEQRERIVALLNRHVRVGWNYGRWPEAVATEERTVEAETDPARSVVRTTPVAGVDTFTAVGSAVAMYVEDPEAVDYVPRTVRFAPRSGKLVIMDSSAPDTVWLEFRRMPPVFSGKAWDDSIGTYAVGDVRYYGTTGECYRCVAAPTAGTLPTDDDFWEKMDFPAWLSEFVAALTTADLLGGDDRKGRADALKGEAEDALANAYANEMDEQGVVTKAGVAAY